MLSFFAVALGVFLVVAVLFDMLNTLVTTNTGKSNWWLSRVLARADWAILRRIGVRLGEGPRRDRLLAAFAPVFVLQLLVVWVAQQILGFGLIWWGIGGIEGVNSFWDAVYYSGIVFFTVGFGEVLPHTGAARTGALVEAFAGVLTTALVIGYLPALYGAFSERERKLMTLDDGSEERITPTNLVVAWSPNADPEELLSRFREWEEWIAGIIETHATFPMLRFFRSHHAGQNWITALGLISDAALHCELIPEAAGREGYWLLRRSARLFQDLTEGVDLSSYREAIDAEYEEAALFDDLYDTMEAHGFNLVPREEAMSRNIHLRRGFDAPMEFMIDTFLAPRGFWSPKVGVKRVENN